MTTFAIDRDLEAPRTQLVDCSRGEAVAAPQRATRANGSLVATCWFLLFVAVTLGAGVALAAAPSLVATTVVGWGSWLAVNAGAVPVWTSAELLRRLGAVLVAGLASVTVLDLGRPGMVDVSAMVLVGGLVLIGWWAQVRSSRPRVVVVGSGPAVQRAMTEWEGRRDVSVVGAEVVGRDKLGHWVPVHRDRVPGAPWDCVVKRVEECDAEVVVCLADDGPVDQDLRELGWAMESTPAQLVVSSAVDEAAHRRVSHRRLGGRSVTVIGSSAPTRFVAASKSCFDRLAALLALVVVGPLMLLVAAAVRLDSDGPVLFRQVRVGRDGQPFTMLKFRSMVVEAEDVKHLLSEADQGNGVLFKIRRDPRVTRIGRLLRRTSLDELPQLINVLRGDMSLVGPRPALPTEVARYDRRAARRLAVRPGLTGLWQVSGRSDLGWQESLRLDLDYTDNVSLGRDLAICARTFRAVLTGRGAY